MIKKQPLPVQRITRAAILGKRSLLSLNILYSSFFSPFCFSFYAFLFLCPFIFIQHLVALLRVHFKVKLVGISNYDIVDGKSKPTLGLIWSIILRFQVRKDQLLHNVDICLSKLCFMRIYTVPSFFTHWRPDAILDSSCIRSGGLRLSQPRSESNYNSFIQRLWSDELELSTFSCNKQNLYHIYTPPL